MDTLMESLTAFDRSQISDRQVFTRQSLDLAGVTTDTSDRDRVDLLFEYNYHSFQVLDIGKGKIRVTSLKLRDVSVSASTAPAATFGVLWFVFLKGGYTASETL